MPYGTISYSKNNDIELGIKEVEYSEEYKEWLKLNEEEKKYVLEPYKYDIKEEKNSDYLNTMDNVFKISTLLGETLSSRYSLQDVIPDNVTIKNQMRTGGCWAFSAIGDLESNLAILDKKNSKPVTIYDYSERHMVYSLIRSPFKDGKINENGFNKNIEGGSYLESLVYLTNGSGAIPEEEMPFENNEDTIDISEIKNKTLCTTLLDAKPWKNPKTEQERMATITKIKQNISNYGGIIAGIASPKEENDEYYNVKTAALYHNDTNNKIGHSILIIGWDDNYNKSNFNSKNQPKNNGAWIIKNSWGTDNGDHGYIYVSYEDIYIYTQLFNIEKAVSTKKYNNIYQNDILGPSNEIKLNDQYIYLANVFSRNVNKQETLNAISVYAPENYNNCVVYVNTSGNSKAPNDIVKAKLKAGDSQNITIGYHTLEFAEPIKLTGNSFMVMIGIDNSSKQDKTIALESKSNVYSIKDEYTKNAIVNEGESFITNGDNIKVNKWTDCAKLSSIKSSLPDGNLCIKAFTLDNTPQTPVSLTKIEIYQEPNKNFYKQNEEKLDLTGGNIKAIYNNGTIKYIDMTNQDVSVQGFDNTKIGQQTITLTYCGKTTSFNITIIKNVTLTSIEVFKKPTKLQYIKLKEKLNLKGGIIKAIYSDNSTSQIYMTNKDVSVKGYDNTKIGQQTITLTYHGKKTSFNVEVVNSNNVTVSKIEIGTKPSKLEYKQNKEELDLTGGTIVITYSDNSTKNIAMTDKSVSVEGFDNTKVGIQTITLTYNGKITTFDIKIIKEEEEKKETTLEKIEVSSNPTKLEYKQNEEKLDLTGGVIKATYSDLTTKNIAMSDQSIAVQGFNNTKVGMQTITLVYYNKTTTFDIEIIENVKAKPISSNFDNTVASITNAEVYVFTDASKESYTEATIKITNIQLGDKDDTYQYEYYISSTQGDDNIDASNWTNVQSQNIVNENDGTYSLILNLNSKTLSYLKKDTNILSSLFIYLKETAKIDDNSATVIKTIKTNINCNVMGNLDGEEVGTLDDLLNKINKTTETNISSDSKKDSTTANTILPQTGTLPVAILITIILLAIGMFSYYKFKNIDK